MSPCLLLLLAAGPTDPEWLERLPSAQSLGPILEQVVPEVSLGVEESGGFASPDGLRPSILGDSWRWTNWYWDDHDITDPLASGQAAFTVPFPLLSRLQLGLDSDPSFLRPGGLALRTRARRDPTVGLWLGTPQLGDLTPGALPLTRAFSSTHPRDRARPPPEERRAPLYRLGLYGFDVHEGEKGRVEYGLEAQLGRRQFLDFAPGDGAYLGTLEEPWARSTGWARYTPWNGAFVATILGEARVRDRLGAEVGYGPLETQRERRLTLHVGIEGGDTKLSFTLTQQHTVGTLDFKRELLDPDGAGLSPFEPDGDRVGLNFDVFQTLGSGYLQLGHRASASSPRTETVVHPLSFDGAPYGSLTVRSRTSAQLVGNHRLGIAEHFRTKDFAFRYDLYGSLAYGLHESGGNDLVFADFGANFGGRYQRFRAVQPFFELAKTPIALSTELVRSLDAEAYASALRLGPNATLYDTQGGAFTEVDSQLLPPSIYSAVVGLEVPRLGPFAFTARGRVKVYDNPLRLSFVGKATEEVDGVAFLRPGQKRYQLENRSDDLPLYFGLELLLSASDPERYLFQLGFLAYGTVGVTPFGNGPLANDLGIVDPSTANPNADRLGLASVDGDRAFVTKAVFSYRIWESLWATATFRHKDGQPFAFFDYVRQGEQLAVIYHSNRGSPLQGQRPLLGPREDFQINVDLAVEQRFWIGELPMKAQLACFNLLDLGNELAEVSGELGKNGRVALEAQLPRTLYFSLALSP